jgi:hypothetical protein
MKAKNNIVVDSKSEAAVRARAFSVELKSRNSVRYASLGDEKKGVDGRKYAVLVEGTLGSLESLGLVEGALLEVVGSEGVLHLDLSSRDLDQLLISSRQKEGRSLH